MRHAFLTILIACLAWSATTSPGFATTAKELDQRAEAALADLYAESPGVRDLLEQSHGYLVFPEVLKAGLLLGGQYGEGVLRIDGKTEGYYSTTAFSYGLQFGAHSFGYLMVFKDPESLAYLRKSDGWDVGSAPTAVFGDEGWSAGLSVANFEKGIGIIFFSQKGVMAGAGLQGTKIKKIAVD